MAALLVGHTRSDCDTLSSGLSRVTLSVHVTIVDVVASSDEILSSLYYHHDRLLHSYSVKGHFNGRCREHETSSDEID